MISKTSTNETAAHFHLSIQDMVLCGMFAALMAVISQLSIPMPTGVPITIQMFGIALMGSVLGSRRGFMAALTYILIGAVGLPVFSNMRGGFHILTNVTGGYLWSYPVMAALCGISPKAKTKNGKLALQLLFATIGLAFSETIGGLQWAALAGDKSVWAIFTYSMVAFVPKDFILTMTAVIIGSRINKTLKQSGYL